MISVNGTIRSAHHLGLAARCGGRSALWRRRRDISFVLYVIGFLIFIAGVAWALDTAGVSRLYVMIASVILGLSLIIASAVSG